MPLGIAVLGIVSTLNSGYKYRFFASAASSRDQYSRGVEKFQKKILIDIFMFIIIGSAESRRAIKR
jgi:hypothetical protein